MNEKHAHFSVSSETFRVDLMTVIKQVNGSIS